jgi:hypothetical protein
MMVLNEDPFFRPQTKRSGNGLRGSSPFKWTYGLA